MKISQLSVQIDPDKPADIYFFVHDPEQLTPVGMLRLGMDESKAGWISSVFVDEKMRGKGLGTALMQIAADVSKNRGQRFLSLAVADKNEGAQRLYKKLGFEEFMTGEPGYMQYIKIL